MKWFLFCCVKEDEIFQGCNWSCLLGDYSPKCVKSRMILPVALENSGGRKGWAEELTGVVMYLSDRMFTKPRSGFTLCYWKWERREREGRGERKTDTMICQTQRIQNLEIQMIIIPLPLEKTIKQIVSKFDLKGKACSGKNWTDWINSHLTKINHITVSWKFCRYSYPPEHTTCRFEVK